MRQFAKLFDFGEQGQLLVQRVNTDEEGEESPYLLVLKTRNEQGVQLEVTPGYFYEAMRDKRFEEFDEAHANVQFTNMQSALLGMTSSL